MESTPQQSRKKQAFTALISCLSSCVSVQARWSVDVCRSLPCGDKVCKTASNGALSCEYPDDDIYCGFEESEYGCQGDLEYFGNFDQRDNADWTPNSGPTLTPNTGNV